MRKGKLSTRAGAVLAAAVASAIVVPMAFTSSHREAPSIMLDPSADNTDVYAWTAPDAEDSITVASNWIPGQVPANGPNFFRFDDRARYYINFDNTGDGVADIRYRYEFDTDIRNPNSFLTAGPNTTSYDGLNLIQTYDVTREEYNKKGKLTDTEVVAEDLNVAPSNIGPKTFPDYENDFVPGAISELPGGGKIFAGQREEPFFVDLGAAFDAINVRVGTGNQGQGKDDFSGYNTSSIVMQLPEEQVTKDGQPVADMDSPNAVVGVWSTTERRRLEVRNADFSTGSPGSVNGKRNKWVQVSRLGNPLVNEVVIPLGMKDKFNRTSPDRDAELYGQFVTEPELAAVLNALFGINAPETDRTDIVQAVLQGIPGLNQHSGPHAGTPVDTLKLNLGVDPSNSPSRFGALGGDLAGYPNGRRPTDDVVDIDLEVVAGILHDPPNAVPLGDGVDKNDTPFLPTFPYLATPYSGFDSNPSQRFEPAHPPTPAGGP
jgi:Domain of unknown function (DUF4331)